MIHVKEVHKYFNKNKISEIHALNNISLDFPDTGLVILKGVSGSGKTTFLNVLGGLDKIKSGEISVDGQVIKGYKAKTWDSIRTNKIGYFFQNYYLIPSLTVFENVALVLKMIGMSDELEIEERVHYILKQVGIYKFRKRHTNQLSGGQQQRVAIARALVKNPKIIIADEPTGNLDSKNTIEVMNIIKKISKKRLVVLVTHEESIAKFYGDRIIEISDGKVVNDYENESSDVYDLEEKDTYYLKDFKHQENYGNISFYTDDGHINLEKDVELKLIYKNGVLVLDVNGTIKKTRLVSEDSGINIVNDHNKIIDKQTFLDTDYESKEIVLDPKGKQSKKFSSIKNNVKGAAINFIKLIRLKKIMLLGFILLGVLTAVSSSIIGNKLFDDYIGGEELENYVYLSKQAFNLEMDEVSSLRSNDDLFWINPYTTDKVRITIPSFYTSNQKYSLEGNLDLIDHISEEDIVHGRMPENIYEIVVDMSVYTNNNEPYSQLTKHGVWNAEQLIGETIYTRGLEIIIVGIADVNSQLIFGDRTTLTLLSYTTGITSLFLSIELLGETGVEIIDGRMPTPGSKEVLIPYNYAGGVPSWAFDSGLYERNGMLISGTYDKGTLPYDNLLYLAYNEDIEYHIFMHTVGDLKVYSSDPEDFLQSLEDNDFIASWPYGDALIEAEVEQNKLMPLLYMSIFIILLSGLGFYYMMRSSMFSRMYEISVKRALGMKNSDLMREFTIELIVITTFSTLVGYLLGSFLIVNFQGASYLKNIAYLNLPAFLLGLFLIYFINILFGRMPLKRQLEKTPAELLSNYDM